MPGPYPPMNPRCPHFLHGGDYNPDQWLHAPDVLAEDMRLMQLAHANAMSVAIFAWATLEPEEGRYEFGWLDDVMDRLAAQDCYAVLATPSAGMPAWLAHGYPEVRRVEADRRRRLHGRRVVNCLTSPILRQKVSAINRKLAERYRRHPALLLWHISNEYGGECHCELCQEAFRAWLQTRYGDLDALNRAWWGPFWSHTYTDWSQIESPSPLGEGVMHGLQVDWMRYTTAQTIDFYRNEIAPLRELSPEVPITTNFMGIYVGLDYFKFAKEVDVACWDSYPSWHTRPSKPAPNAAFPYAAEGGDAQIAAENAFVHDLTRSLKGGQPWLLMESTPSMTNWQAYSKLKRPGVHLLGSLQAVAHGSDSVQYFQWRKSRGGSEKLHGAVVDHVGHERTRVFSDVAEVGQALEQLDAVIGSSVQPDVALLYDWENRWAIDDSRGPRNNQKDYAGTVIEHYRPFWRRGVAVDVVDEDGDFSPYKLLVAPMLYLVREGVGERIDAFVQAGGVFVGTYWSGIVDASDNCYLGGFPGPLRETLGIWSEEIDALADADRNRVVLAEDNPLGLRGAYEAAVLCDLCWAEGAEVVATYGGDFYAGRPALTVNRRGRGQAWYIASRNEPRFTDDFLAALIARVKPLRALEAELPPGVTATLRTDGERRFVFVQNYTAEDRAVALDATYQDLLAGGEVSGELALGPYGVRVLSR